MALEYHPAIGETRARREAAAGVLSQARASLLPSVLSDASVARHQEPMLVEPLHGFDPTMAPSFDRKLVRGNLTLSYSLYDGGARGARIGRAEAGEAMASAGHTASQMDITARVTAAYVGVLSSVELLDAAVRQREALEAEKERVSQFLAEGKAARVDLLRVQATLSQAEAVQISVRSRLGVAQGRLARLTGLSSAEIRGQTLTGVKLGSLPAQGAPQAMEKAMEANPDLSLARQQLAGAASGVREAEANFFPSIQIAGAYADFGALEGGHTQEWQGTLRFSYPLFTGGAREGERDRAVAEERRASEALRRVELAVEEGVEEALASVLETGARREALERAVEQAEEVARIEVLALEVGAGVQTDFLRAQAELFQSRAALAEARHGEVLAGVYLARVMGDLTLSWVQEHMEVVR
jgi:outer membrane protein